MEHATPRSEPRNFTPDRQGARLRKLARNAGSAASMALRAHDAAGGPEHVRALDQAMHRVVDQAVAGAAAAVAARMDVEARRSLARQLRAAAATLVGEPPTSTSE